MYQFPGPNFKGAVDSGSAESAYYNFTDRFDLLGLGENIPLATGNLSEGVLALVDGEFHNFRVPYPLGSFFGKGLDGRIDDPDARLEGAGDLDDVGEPGAVPRRRRDRPRGAGLQVPGAAGPAGPLEWPAIPQPAPRLSAA